MPKLFIDTPRGRQVMTVRGSVGALQAALDTLGHVADRDVAEGAGHPYDLGIRYRAERGEEWRRPWRVAEAGEGDCEDLAAWVAAVRRAEGAEGTRAVLVPTGPRTLHAVVRLPDGSIEDPSVRCGMAGRLLRGPRVAVRRRGAGYAARVWLPAGYMIVVGDGTGPTPAEAYAAACLTACGKLQAFGVAADPGDWTVSGVADSAYARIGEIADTLRSGAEAAGDAGLAALAAGDNPGEALEGAAADALTGAFDEVAADAPEGTSEGASGWWEQAKRVYRIIQDTWDRAREGRAPLAQARAMLASLAAASVWDADPALRRRARGVTPPPVRAGFARWSGAGRVADIERSLVPVARKAGIADSTTSTGGAVLRILPPEVGIVPFLRVGIIPVYFADSPGSRDAVRRVWGDDGAIWPSWQTTTGFLETGVSRWRYTAALDARRAPAAVAAAARRYAAGEGGIDVGDVVLNAALVAIGWTTPGPEDDDDLIVDRLGLLVAAGMVDYAAPDLADAARAEAPRRDSPDSPDPPRRDSPAPLRRDVPRRDSPPATDDGRPLMSAPTTEAAGRLRAIAEAATEADAGWAGLRAVAETLKREGPRSPYWRLIRALVSR